MITSKREREIPIRNAEQRQLLEEAKQLAGTGTSGRAVSAAMVRRYAHLAPAQLAQHAEIVSNLLDGTIAAQPPKEKGLAEANPL